MRRAAVLELDAAVLAFTGYGDDNAESNSRRVRSVPFPTCWRSMPFRCERPDRLEMLAGLRRLAAPPPTVHMERLMIGFGEADEVVDIVVERVAVLVVDVVAFGNRAMGRLPNVAVEGRSAATLVILDSGDEVAAGCEAF